MLIDSFYPGVEIHREDKIIYAKLLHPHTVISTCRAAGGIQTKLACIYNHQGSEPAGHSHRHNLKIWRDPTAWRRITCQRYDLPDEKCATLGTAANMNNAAFVRESFRDLVVGVVCTGGVEVNAGRAGDPASVVETANGFETLAPAESSPGPGTINTMIFINRPLIPGALTRVIMTATEAKSAALQELAVNSRYSDGLATGTGTDQIAVAAMETKDPALTSAGKHAKLGELIGKAVKAAVKETLGGQNSLTPGGQCSSKIHLERFGQEFRLSGDEMMEMICGFLDKTSQTAASQTAEADLPANEKEQKTTHSPENKAYQETNTSSDLLRQNFSVIERDPVTVAAVAAMVHLKDKFTWKVLPPSCWSEVMGSYAAQVACAVGGDYSLMEEYRKKLAPTRAQNDNQAFVKLISRAIAMGFSDKWKQPE